MKSHTVARCAVFCAATLMALEVPAQNVPTRTLARPDAEFAAPFTDITGVRALSDGRVILIDERDRTIQLLDFATGKATTISRQGSGPGEYRLPTALFTLSGDSTAVFDEPNRRILIILPNGRPGKVIALTAPGGGVGFMRRFDGAGRLYADGNAHTTRGGVFTSLDSVPIVRWSPGASRRDTVAYVGRPKGYAKFRQQGNQQIVTVGGPTPFSAIDQWALSPDGRIAVVDADSFIVTWIEPSGRRVATSRIAFTPLRVTEAHKAAWREAQQGGVAVIGDDDKGTVSIVNRPRRKVEGPESWPEFMPPFVRGPRFALDGTLWIQRTAPANSPPTYDVISQASGLTMRVVLPMKSRIVGFGANGAVYVARTDDDDLQHLQRYVVR